MQKTILDTTVLSDFLRDTARKIKNTPAIRFITEYLQEFGRLEFSVVTRFEIRRGLIHQNMKKRLTDFNALCYISCMFLLDAVVRHGTTYPDIWGPAEDLWASLCRNGKQMKDADLLIAATAKVHGYAVATRDNDFELLADIIPVTWIG